MEPRIEEVMTLKHAAQLSGIAYTTLVGAAREGRLRSKRTSFTWLTTRAWVVEAINNGTLKPRKHCPFLDG